MVAVHLFRGATMNNAAVNDATVKRLAFVSSFDESCGNAYFTQILIDGVNKIAGWQGEGIGLDLFLTQSVSKRLRGHADQHIQAVAEKLKTYDAVNIQFEAALFGTVPGDLRRRFEQLVCANPHTSVTLHSPRLAPADSATQRRIIKNLLQLKIKEAVKDFRSSAMANIQIKVNCSIMDIIVQHKIPVIVHTLRSKKTIEKLYDYHNVTVHPLKFVRDDFVADANVMQQIKTMLAVQPTDILIGMFGYISAYKGHSDALQALALLPQHYKLLIFGRQHPQSITANQSDPYIQSLLVQCKQLGLMDRVYFMGELPNHEFECAAAGVDVCWLPYYENGQDGSGIASVCLDVGQRVLCSSSFAFDELFRLSRYNNYMRFDIGNYGEIASKTAMIFRCAPLVAAPAIYTCQSQAECYVKASAGSEVI